MSTAPPAGSTPPSQHRPEQVVTMVVVGLVLLYALWMLRTPAVLKPPSDSGRTPTVTAVSPDKIPLVTGDEPVKDIFTRAGCPVCHTIPGIPGAMGQVGPPLVLGTTGAQRLIDPSYRGQAATVRDYIVESIMNPGVFVVPGYPERTMPTWYGTKLSALAVEKIADYLERQTDRSGIK